MPFTATQFFDVFAGYNRALWPAVLGFWVLSLGAVGRLARGRGLDRPTAGLLALLWAWGGVVYHWGFFTAINPAAWLFGALFVIQAAGFGWAAVHGGSRVTHTRPIWRLPAVGLLAAGLCYPLLALASGHPWPRVPSYGVPCPTTLLTAGVLLAAGSAVPRWLFVIPIGWALIGGSAALWLGVVPDLLLFAAAAALFARLVLKESPQSA